MFKITLLAFSIAPFVFPAPTFAHAFGQIYVLPIPAWLYLYAGGAAVTVSFMLIAYFVTTQKQQLSYPAFDLSKYRILTLLTSDTLKTILQSLSVLIATVAILAGFLGSPNTTENLEPAVFWIFTLLGVTYLSAVVGNIWSTISPFKIIADFFDLKKSKFSYPPKLGYIPALVFYFATIWLELLSHGIGTNPLYLAKILIGYTALTLIGSYFFGKDLWFKYFDFFSVFFGLIVKISPFEKKDGKLYLRPPFVGLLKINVTHFSLLLFILFMLSSTAFDGFHSTRSWLKIYITFLPLERVVGDNFLQIFETIILFLSPLFFFTLYILAIGIMKPLVKTSHSLKSLALLFAPSLIPIALAYNIAHYYTLLLIQGQTTIAHASDPFNFGWNLFGTVNFVPNIGIVGASFVWHSQVATIIIGHIAAVYLAHVISLNVFLSHKKAIVSQIPMLFLMVAYTMTGLWILSQPLTVGG